MPVAFQIGWLIAGAAMLLFALFDLKRLPLGGATKARLGLLTVSMIVLQFNALIAHVVLMNRGGTVFYSAVASLVVYALLMGVFLPRFLRASRLHRYVMNSWLFTPAQFCKLALHIAQAGQEAIFRPRGSVIYVDLYRHGKHIQSFWLNYTADGKGAVALFRPLLQQASDLDPTKPYHQLHLEQVAGRTEKAQRYRIRLP